MKKVGDKTKDGLVVLKAPHTGKKVFTALVGDDAPQWYPVKAVGSSIPKRGKC